MDFLNYLQSLGIILLILSLVPLGLHFYKKWTPKLPASDKIKILAIKPINYKAQILLLEVENQKILIGLTDKGFTFLGEIKNESSS